MGWPALDRIQQCQTAFYVRKLKGTLFIIPGKSYCLTQTSGSFICTLQNRNKLCVSVKSKI